MKYANLLWLCCFFIWICNGCTSNMMYQERTTKELIAKSVYDSLPEDLQNNFQPVKVTGIKPDVSNTIDTGLNAAHEMAKASKDILPSPFGEIAIGTTALALLIWQVIKRRKVKTVTPDK